jgi:serine/threonine protein kinase
MTISNYTLKQKIGEGGMATVYQAEHKMLGSIVAVKLLNEELVRNQNIRHRFLFEAKNMAKMSHPNIIKVSDLIDQDDTVAIVMEYIEGETLKEYLDKKGKLPASEIKGMLNQMLDAIEYVHEHSLVHRDIKPSNFMLSKNGELKLLDFGIAKNTDKTSSDYTQTGTMQSMGTPMYMSPEQIKSTKDVTGQSDIYSLGVVLWQMAMGFKPYDTNTTSNFELQTKIVTEPLPPTSTEFDGIIQKATAKNLEDRYKSCGEMKVSLSSGSSTSMSSNKTVNTATPNPTPGIDKTVVINNDKTVLVDNNTNNGNNLIDVGRNKQNLKKGAANNQTLNGIQYFFKAIQNYAVFKGRARRKEYWYYILFYNVFSILFMILPPLSILYFLGLIVPTLAVGVRRMHDVGKSGWYLLIPIYGLILTFTEGDKGSNAYGADPKAI